MTKGYDFWLIMLSVLMTSTTLFYSCNFIKRIYTATSSDRPTLLTIYSVTIGCMLFCMDNLNWVAMNPIVGDTLSVPMILGSLFAAIFAVFTVYANASEKRLPFSNLINRGIVVNIASYMMFYLSFASRHSANAMSFDVPNLFFAMFSGTIISAFIIFYYFKMKASAIIRPTVRNIILSFAAGSSIALLYAIFNTTVMVQKQILAGTHTVDNREIIATLFSLSIAGLLAITYYAPKYLEKIKQKLSTIHLFDNYYTDEINTKDTLTQLANRQGFEQHLDAAIKRSTRLGKTIALAFIDLDHFKPVNDNFGHHVGDAVLVAVAQRLNKTVRACDFVARLGGDEFVAIIEDIAYDEDITPIIGRVVNSIKESFNINQHHIDISCSVGVAVYPGDGDIDKLMVCADAAMYKAKENGKNQFKFFDAEIELASDQMLDMQRDLRQAINNKEFILLFQPKVDCKTQKPIGAEALVRWNHPTKGLILPNEFLPVAERFGLVNSINDWVIEEACRAVARAKKINVELNISINLARQQFRNPSLVQEIVQVIQRHDISTSNLMFEIKETTAIKNETLFKALLEDFKDADIKVALDDFGSHNFSLSYLQQLNINELKLDQQFIGEINENKASYALVDAVIRLAHALDLNVVAEGVETEAQHRALAELGCDQMQGYLFSKPIPEMKLVRLFKNLNVNYEMTGEFNVADYQAEAA